MIKRIHAAVIVATATTLSLAMPATAFAASGDTTGRQTMQLDCAGAGTLTIETTPTVVQDSWNAAQVLDGGHLVPVAFTFLAYDETAAVTLDEETLTHKAAHNQQPTTTCVSSQTALLGDLAAPGTVLPGGLAATDTVTLSLIATVIAKP